MGLPTFGEICLHMFNHRVHTGFEEGNSRAFKNLSKPDKVFSRTKHNILVEFLKKNLLNELEMPFYCTRLGSIFSRSADGGLEGAPVPSLSLG